ncbi:MAG: hypothetical protein HPY52_15530 [Firmicutes bacterium]|nr:hypothetical protein [Bacillota bacterium]
MVFSVGSFKVEITRMDPRQGIAPDNSRAERAHAISLQDKYVDEVKNKAVQLMARNGVIFPR